MQILNLLWLRCVLGIAGAGAADIISGFSMDNLYEARRDPKFRMFLNGEQLVRADRYKPDDFISIVQDCEKRKITLLAINDVAYPDMLRQSPTPPVILFVRGDVTVISESFLFAVVGTRTPSEYGVAATIDICRELVRAGIVLTSGLAAGLDSVAHKVSVSEGAPTVAVLGNGVDFFYPMSNRVLQETIAQNGAVVSEYLPDEKPTKYSFLQRNRIIVGLCYGVLIGEARRRSGTMNTAVHAAEAGREIFAVPGNIFSPLSVGTNLLIRDGATLVSEAADILRCYGFIEEPFDKKIQKFEDISPEAKIILSKITFVPIGAEELCLALEMPTGRILAALSELEIAGRILQSSGRLFVLKG